MKRFFSSLCALVVVATVATGPARADDAVPVTHFEAAVSSSLSLAAMQSGIDADTYAVAALRDHAGPVVYISDAVGPRHDRLSPYASIGYVYFDQGVGLRWPVLGSRAEQQAAIVSADIKRRMAQYNYAIVRNELIAKVRENYAAYFSARRTEQAAQAMLTELGSDTAATAALRRNGFWTRADQLRYADLTLKAQTDEARAQMQQREALEELSLLTNAEVAPFEPLRPEYASCESAAQFAVSSSYNSDPLLASLVMQRTALAELLPMQKWMGVNASVDLSVHGFYKQTGRTGYLGLATLDVSMPLRGLRGPSDDAMRLRAQLRETDLRIQARRSELRTGVAVALATRGEAQKLLAAAEFDKKALAEDLRETQVRFANVTPDAMTDVHHKLQLAYQAQLAIVSDDNSLLQSTARLLQLSPEACTSVSSTTAAQKGTRGTP